MNDHTQTDTRNYTIDANNKRLGDVCTEAARYLMGKDNPDFARNAVAPVSVTIINASAMDIPLRKQKETYQRYSGYPSGRKTERLDHLAHRLGYSEVIHRSIHGMLPSNRLRKPRLKNLTITE